MYEEEYLLDAAVYAISAFLGFRYSECFLQGKYTHRKKGMNVLLLRMFFLILSH